MPLLPKDPKKVTISGVPPPKASPMLRAPGDPGPEGNTKPGDVMTVGRHKRDMRRSSLFTFLTVILGGAVFSPGCMDIGTRLIGQKGRLDTVEQTVKSIQVSQTTQAAEQREIRTDIRSLYNALVVKAPQERLEKAAPAVMPAVDVSPDGGFP